MFNTKSLLLFTTTAILMSGAAGQSWEVIVFEPSAGGTSSCTGGGTTISGSDFGCHTVGLGSNEASFTIDLSGTVNPPGAIWAFDLFSDNNCQVFLPDELGPGACFAGSVVHVLQRGISPRRLNFNIAEMPEIEG
ncbi:hypothetical protein DFH06DRAFT_1295494 [Mycena polygramma]|nr:hypothetical protein DFH06DRAFT_1295494 [Mycena polygramma]